MGKSFRIPDAREIDLVNYLASLGYAPDKVRGNDYWYLSPLREEKHASFKVNRKLNLWYDHGMGKGGTLIDFGILYHRCSVKLLLARLKESRGNIVSFHPPAAVEKKNTENLAGEPSFIHIIQVRQINSPDLTDYLNKRMIPIDLARQYCHEIDFEIYGKSYTALGFQNDLGGFELRNHFFKGSSKPKSPALIIGAGSCDLSVFEGFFSFLSYKALSKDPSQIAGLMPGYGGDILVLNSLSYFEKSRSRMESYSSIHLFLDWDKMGIQYTQKALSWSERYIDQSHFYQPHKDLNEKLVHQQSTRQSSGHRIRWR